MAITGGDRHLWRQLRARGLVPENPEVLEIGKANWYGDISTQDAVADWYELNEDRCGLPSRSSIWQAADWFYEWMLRGPRRTAIDLDPHAKGAIRHNLNEPLPDDLVDCFDIVINTGTTEHVFDQRRAWESIHDACRPGGLMVHAVPLWGWLDHGFVNYQPTLIADVATENGYEVLAWLFYELTTGFMANVAEPKDFEELRGRDAGAMMHVALKKDATESRFRVPMQGVYSSRVTEEQLAAWRTNR